LPCLKASKRLPLRVFVGVGMLCSGSMDQTVRMWDTASHSTSHCFADFNCDIYSVCSIMSGTANNRTNHQLFTGDADGHIKCFDIASRVCIRSTQLDLAPLHLCPSNDGSKLFAGFCDGTLTAFDSLTLAPCFTRKVHDSYIWTICASKNGKFMASGSYDGTIALMRDDDVEDNDEHKESPITALQGHTREIHSVYASSNGSKLFSSAWDKSIRIWDTATGRSVRTIETPKTVFALTTTVTNAGDEILITACGDRTVGIWTCEGELISTLKGHTRDVRALTVSTDGQTVFSGSDDKTVRAWELRMMKEYEGGVGETMTGHTGWVRSLCII
jgi:WD40 repeat protein